MNKRELAMAAKQIKKILEKNKMTVEMWGGDDEGYDLVFKKESKCSECCKVNGGWEMNVRVDI